MGCVVCGTGRRVELAGREVVFGGVRGFVVALAVAVASLVAEDVSSGAGVVAEGVSSGAGVVAVVV